VQETGQVTIRDATEADLAAIIEIAKATGQVEDWTTVYPSYVRHLMAHGRLLVSVRDGRAGGAPDERRAGGAPDERRAGGAPEQHRVIGFGGTRQIGTGPAAVSMLTDLFVDPAAHGTGTGRAILDALWGREPRKMTFSSLHSNALPLYTSFGVDAWWPLLYLAGDVSRLRRPAGWSVETAGPADVAALELAWTGVDRTADHQMWAARPSGASIIASRNGQPSAAGTIGGAGDEYGISHLVVAGTSEADAGLAADAVIAALSFLDPSDGRAHACLPAPHPAVRRLLGAGWKISEFDLYMASEPGLLDPLSSVLSPALA
jgi:GNAT superfamily N-acetyltransferase